MSRIKLEDTVEDALLTVADGNPAAIMIMTRILKEAAAIDPQDCLGGLGVIMDLDTYGIYGPRIWMLYSDVCGKDLVKMLAVMRALQLGKLETAALQHAIDNRGKGVDLDAILADVKAYLKEFDRPLLPV